MMQKDGAMEQERLVPIFFSPMQRKGILGQVGKQCGSVLVPASREFKWETIRLDKDIKIQYIHIMRPARFWGYFGQPHTHTHTHTLLSELKRALLECHQQYYSGFVTFGTSLRSGDTVSLITLHDCSAHVDVHKIRLIWKLRMDMTAHTQNMCMGVPGHTSCDCEVRTDGTWKHVMSHKHSHYHEANDDHCLPLV